MLDTIIIDGPLKGQQRAHYLPDEEPLKFAYHTKRDGKSSETTYYLHENSKRNRRLYAIPEFVWSIKPRASGVHIAVSFRALHDGQIRG